MRILPNKKILNTTLTSTAVWYPVDMATAGDGLGACAFNVRCRANNAMKMSYDAAGATYVTIPAGQTYFEDQLKHINMLYLQGTNNGDVAETVMYW